MSIDYDAICFKCRLTQHAGQVSAATPGFGYSSKDLEGSNAVAKFIFEHVDSCGSVTIVNANDAPISEGGWKHNPLSPEDEEPRCSFIVPGYGQCRRSPHPGTSDHQP